MGIVGTRQMVCGRLGLRMDLLQGGVFLLALGFFRLGFLDNMLARPLLCGLINAVAFVIILEQTVRTG